MNAINIFNHPTWVVDDQTIPAPLSADQQFLSPALIEFSLVLSLQPTQRLEAFRLQPSSLSYPSFSTPS